MEEGVNDRNEGKMKIMMKKKWRWKTDSDSTTIDEGKGVVNERGGKDVDLD